MTKASKNIPGKRAGTRSGLTVGFAVVIALMTSLIYVSTNYLETIQVRLQRIVGEHQQKLDIAVHMRTTARERALSITRLVVLRDAFEQDAEWMRFNDLAAEFAAERSELIAMGLDPKEQRILRDQGHLTTHILPIQAEIVRRPDVTLDSLRRLADLDAPLVLPGHGPPFAGTPADAVARALRAFFSARLAAFEIVGHYD